MGAANFIAFLFATALLVSCGNNETRESNPYVVTTTGMIADAVRNIGGDSISVEALMGPGVDPHLYKATQGDLKRLMDADIVFYNGLHLEGKMGEVLEKLGRQKPVIPVASNIPEGELRLADGFAGAHDPHIWFSASLWKRAVVEISETLKSNYPHNASYFDTNTKKYLAQLDSLEGWIHDQVSTLPPEQRILVTAHDAFGYFGDAYGFTVRGLQGLSTVAEFGLKDRTDLVEYIVSNQVKAVFVETSVPKRSIEAVIAGCSDRGVNVIIGGNLYSDAMGPEGTEEGTYIGMFRSNVSSIVNALK